MIKEMTQGDINGQFTNYALMQCSIIGISGGMVELHVSQADIDRLYEFAVIGQQVMMTNNGRHFIFGSVANGVVSAEAVRVI